MEIKIFTDEEEFITKSADYIANNFFDGAKIALSGGKTPGPIYSALGKRNEADFTKVDFFMVDERYVPINDDNSNFKLIVDAMPKIHLHSFDTTLPINECVENYEEKLKEYLEDHLDLTVLGIGTDGHFASLFPNSAGLNEKEKLAIHTQTDVHPIKERLTITLPLIMQSNKILALLRGKDKWEIVQKLSDKNLSYDDFPARHLMNHHNLLIHYFQS